jgi:hypothetical protein
MIGVHPFVKPSPLVYACPLLLENLLQEIIK